MNSCIPIVFAMLFGVILPSINGLSCYLCSHTVGQLEDTRCRDGSTTQKFSDNSTVCIVTGYFTSQKSLVQMTRGGMASQNPIPYANSDCFATQDSNGATVYAIYCTCSTDNCNTAVITNCKCEKSVQSGANHVSPKSILLGGIALVAVFMQLF